jgi:hypothetical protein
MDQRHGLRCRRRSSTTEGDTWCPMNYHIRIKGHLEPQWATWFEGFTIILEASGDSLLIGPVTDQAALYGLLSRVRDVGLPLVSVAHSPSCHADAPDPL